jgi:hypothetical protein
MLSTVSRGIILYWELFFSKRGDHIEPHVKGALRGQTWPLILQVWHGMTNRKVQGVSVRLDLGKRLVEESRSHGLLCVRRRVSIWYPTIIALEAGGKSKDMLETHLTVLHEKRKMLGIDWQMRLRRTIFFFLVFDQNVGLNLQGLRLGLAISSPRGRRGVEKSVAITGLCDGGKALRIFA